MGNSNRKLQLMKEHEAEMAMIRNKHNENERKLLIEELALKYNLEKHKAEIERLARLDAYHYDIEKKKIEADIRKNDQFNEREKTKIKNNFINSQKALSNEELKINHIHNENILKENNRNENKNTEMKLEFENEKYKIKNQQMDIIMQRENEAEKNRQDYENVRKNNENNFEYNIREINRKARKDNFEHEENMQNINNNYLLNKSEIDNKFILRKEELNNEYDIQKSELLRKENKDKLEYENRKTEIENKYRLENNKITLQTALIDKIYHKKEIEIKNQHVLDVEESKRKTQKLESDIDLEKNKQQLQYEAKIVESKNQHEEKMAQMKNGQDKELTIMKNNHELLMKKMEADEKEREFQRNKELMILNAGIQRGNAMMFANINKANQAMNEKDQENNFSINNGNNMQMPIVFPTFGMNNMGPYYMNNSPFGCPSCMNMNMMNTSPYGFPSNMNMNMMTNYQKPEKK